MVRQNHNFFVAVLEAFQPAQNAQQSDRYVVLERGKSRPRPVKKRDIVFLSDNGIATCSVSSSISAEH